VKKDMLDHNVYNDKKQKIGEVEDVIVSPKNNTLSWAIIGVGGFLGIGKHQVAIPMDQLTRQGKNFLLPGATKAALKAMPEFHYAT
jgi:sporulation protein YlmC with PRC-barrel domain